MVKVLLWWTTKEGCIKVNIIKTFEEIQIISHTRKLKKLNVLNRVLFSRLSLLSYKVQRAEIYISICAWRRPTTIHISICISTIAMLPEQFSLWMFLSMDKYTTFSQRKNNAFLLSEKFSDVFVHSASDVFVVTNRGRFLTVTTVETRFQVCDITVV